MFRVIHDHIIPVFIVAFGILFFGFYAIDLHIPEIDKVFITISTFFFSIFCGFFISRQTTRYTKIRETIAAFDGKMTGIYRVSQNVSAAVQAQIAVVLSEHYARIIETKSWDYHFLNKSSTVTRVHEILETEIGGSKQESLRNQGVGRVLAHLTDAQVLRKSTIMLYHERIPHLQWFLIYAFVGIIFLAVAAIPAQGNWVAATIKSSFIIAVSSVVFILINLDNLHLFESFIGEGSAQDVLDIMKNVK